MNNIPINFPHHRTIIVTAADTGYFWLLREFLESLEAHPKSKHCHVGVIDVGLEAQQIEWLTGKVEKLVDGKWDISFAGFEKAPRYKQALTVTPFLPDYFPGYDVYMWIDRDAWVQDWTAVEMYIEGALRDGMAAVPELDRNYPTCVSGLRLKLYPNIPFFQAHIRRIKTLQYRALSQFYSKRLSQFYSKRIGRQLMFEPVVNAGIFAIRSDAPHWPAWQESYRAARIYDHTALSDQTPLNHAICTKQLPVHRLPSTFNWLTCFGPPMLDDETGMLVEPSLPHTPIGLLHLAGAKKDTVFDIRTPRGKSYKSQLNLGSVRSLQQSVLVRRNGDLAEPPKKPI